MGQLSSPNDPVPPQLFTEVLPPPGPYLHCIIDSCLSSGVVLVNFKRALLQPLLKKPVLDPAVMVTLKPISRSFLFKILERTASSTELKEPNILNMFQFVFKKLSQYILTYF